MAKNIIPTKTIKRTHTNVISIKDDYQQKLIAIEQIKGIQAEIDKYNEEVEKGEIPAFFNSMVLMNDFLVVKLYKENFIKGWNTMEIKIDDEGTMEKVAFPYGGFRQIDGRTRTSDVEQHVDTPLPYVFKGKIMAISPYMQKKIKEDYGVDISAGSFITLNELILKDRRFYFEKQKQIVDHITNQREVVLYNFEGYFGISSFDIESILTNSEHFKNQ